MTIPPKPRAAYSPRFFQNLRHGVQRSAEAVVPLVVKLLQPSTVLDVGCGTGIWLSLFVQHGVVDVIGVDGDYVDHNMLQIPVECFLAADLQEPLSLTRNFDLVVSLEVAEHLPAKCAESFIGSLVQHSDCVLFSAAIPHQGGTSHLNEQFPSYWADHFSKHGYEAWDLLRPEIWTDAAVERWYAQNMLLYVKQGEESRYPCLSLSTEMGRCKPLDVVHPRQYLKAIDARQAAEKSLWNCRAELVDLDIEKHVPTRNMAVLIDDGSLNLEASKTRRIVRPLEIEAVFQGQPPDFETAMQRINHLRELNASHLVQTWQAFWWESRYAGFDAYLRQEAKCLVANDRCRIFEFADQRERLG